MPTAGSGQKRALTKGRFGVSRVEAAWALEPCYKKDEKMIGSELTPARKIRAIAIAGATTLALMGVTTTLAQDLRVPSDGRLHDLSALYGADAVDIVADVCIQRFPQTRSDWGQTVQVWKRNNVDALAALGRLQAELGTALRATRPASVDVDTWAAIVNARFEWIGTVYQMLAPMGDIQAKPYCESARADYARQMIDSDTMSQAETAVAAAVADLGEDKYATMPLTRSTAPGHFNPPLRAQWEGEKNNEDGSSPFYVDDQRGHRLTMSCVFGQPQTCAWRLTVSAACPGSTPINGQITSAAGKFPVKATCNPALSDAHSATFTLGDNQDIDRSILQDGIWEIALDSSSGLVPLRFNTSGGLRILRTISGCSFWVPPCARNLPAEFRDSSR